MLVCGATDLCRGDEGAGKGLHRALLPEVLFGRLSWEKLESNLMFQITSRPNDLKKCFDEKDNILEDFLTCFENRVEA